MSNKYSLSSTHPYFSGNPKSKGYMECSAFSLEKSHCQDIWLENKERLTYASEHTYLGIPMHPVMAGIAHRPLYSLYRGFMLSVVGNLKLIRSLFSISCFSLQGGLERALQVTANSILRPCLFFFPLLSKGLY